MDDTTLRVIVVDDEALARQVLREHLEARGDVEILAECANGFEAVKAISERQPDLVLLDIQMPKLDGFEVLELVGRHVPVVFITAYDEFAVRAFEVHAVDYLLKPFSGERIGEAIDRARARLGQDGRAVPTEGRGLDARAPEGRAAAGESGPASMDEGAASPGPSSLAKLRADARRDSGPVERVLIRDGSRVHVLPVDEIDFVQAQDDYVCFHVAGKQFLKEQPLAEVEQTLDPARFVRVHRSYVLNIDRLARVEPLTKDSRIAILKDGRRLPLSRAGYQRLNALL